jgi:hypothetical protein
MADADVVGTNEANGQTRHWLVNGVVLKAGAPISPTGENFFSLFLSLTGSTYCAQAIPPVRSMCRPRMARPSRITLDPLPPREVDRIGKTQSRLSNLESSHSAFLRLYAVLTLPLSLPITSYVILLLPQPSDFSPPANLSKPNVGVSTFELTDYISVRLTKLTRRFIIVPSGFINSESFVVCRKAILASPLR